MKANKRVRDLARRAKKFFSPKAAKPQIAKPIATVVEEPVVRTMTPAEELDYLFATYQKKGKNG